MHTDPHEKTVISSLGWADQGAVWLFDVATGREEKRHLSDADYLSIRPGRDRYYAIVHQYESGQLRISAHSFEDPAATLSEYQVAGGDRSFEGDLDVWQYLPRHYVAYLVQPAWSNYALISLDGAAGLSLQTFDWFDESYDKGYQGIVGVIDVPGANDVIVSVQRSSRLILYSPEAGLMLRAIDLAGGYGNPSLRISRDSQVLWVDDYDTLLKIETGNWSIVAHRKLQEAERGTAQFIGNFSLNTDETLCAVPRPFSGDILGLSTEDLSTRYHVEVGQQPLEATILHDGRVVARDWQTGALLVGKMW